jgi:hypothetical protein
LDGNAIDAFLATTGRLNKSAPQENSTQGGRYDTHTAAFRRGADYAKLAILHYRPAAIALLGLTLIVIAHRLRHRNNRA